MRQECGSSITPAAASRPPSRRVQNALFVGVSAQAALARELPAAKANERPSLLVAGALAEVVEDQFRRIFSALGIEDVSFLPPRSSTALPAVGPNTKLLLAQPFLGEAVRALEARGATLIPAPFPLGSEGTALWLQAAAEAFGVAPERFAAITAPGRERASHAVARHRAVLKGKRVFFFPDSQLEPPLARFLHRELGAEIVEVGTPFLHRLHQAEEWALLPDDVFVSEGQDVERQLDRCLAEKPDLVVCGLGLANPLEARGITTKWSIELVFSPIQGFEQAGDLAELFARPFARRERLKVGG